MIKFPSIAQFRSVINTVKHKASFMGLDDDGVPMYNKFVKLPTLSFFGTVKLHGTNASIVQNMANGFLSYQSRENVLSVTSDNAGFCNAMIKHEEYLQDLFTQIRFTMKLSMKATDDMPIAIFGEWCGGNIQQGVAINGLDKMFVIFAARIGKEATEEDPNPIHTWIRPHMFEFNNSFSDLDKPFYSIAEFPTYEVNVDFEHPEIAQNEFVKLTLEVENECPAAKAFEVSGIGEGIVWYCKEYTSSDFVFKTKGEKHSASKVKTIAAVDVEKIAAINELVDTILTENRMLQMVEGVERDAKNTGLFIQKCMKDCIKEETDTIVENGFTVKEFTHAAMAKARRWFLS